MKATGITGICGSGIIEILAEMHIAGILSTDGVIDGAVAAAPAHRRRRADFCLSHFRECRGHAE